MSYNGHKNWNHWNVSLWVNNDESIYREACRLISRHGKDGAARRLLAQLPEKTPDGAPYSLTTVRAALVGM